MGAQIVFFSLVLGWSCNRYGLAFAGYLTALFIAASSLFPLWLAVNGELGSPPQENVSAAAVANRPHTTGVGGPPTRCKDLVRSSTFWQFFLHQSVVPFAGFGMKLLLTSVFQAAYGTSFLDAAYLATLSIVVFGLARALFPLLVKPGNLALILAAMNFLNALLYASNPAIIANLPIWCLVLSKTLAGACFAGMLCMNPLLLLEAYTPSELPIVFEILGLARCIGFGFGPLAGYYISILSKESGTRDQDVYNSFFYTCAALAAIAGLNMATLYARLSRNLAEEKTEELSGCATSA